MTLSPKLQWNILTGSTYNFPRCNVCFGVNYMGFEEGWTASHKQCNSVNQRSLKKWKKSSDHDVVSYMLYGGIWMPECGNILLVESRIRINFAYGIRNDPRFWNPEYNSRNPESHSRLVVLLTNSGIQNLQSGIHGLESRIQDCPGFSYTRQASNWWNRSRFRLKRTC